MNGRIKVGGLILVGGVASLMSFIVAGVLYSWFKTKVDNKIYRLLCYFLCIIAGFIAGVIAGAIVISVARGLPENTLSVLMQSAFIFAIPCPLFERLRK